MAATLEVVVQKCSNCGYVFSADQVKTCRLCKSSICPECERCNCAPLVPAMSAFNYAIFPVGTFFAVS